MAIGVLMNPATQATCTTSTLNIGDIPDSLDVTTADGTTITLGRAQLTHAATIITVGGHTPGVNRDAVIIALMAALTESGLRNLANTTTYPQTAGMPNDGDGGDHDSLGLFQMRHQTGWGSVNNLMDPTYQARAFYGGAAGPNHGSPPGLLDIKNWQTLPKGAAAQAVEVSAHPDRYTTWQPAANTILNTLTTPSGDTDVDVPETTTVVFPLPSGSWVETSSYGMRIHPISGKPTFHAGIDLAAKDGTPILAVADGTVTFAGTLSGYGHAIDIKHTIGGQQVISRYGHMWAGHLYVNTGDQVAAGQHIADVGSDGHSTGPHLHFETHINDNTTDPSVWLAQHGATNLDQPSVTTLGCYIGGTL